MEHPQGERPGPPADVVLLTLHNTIEQSTRLMLNDELNQWDRLAAMNDMTAAAYRARNALSNDTLSVLLPFCKACNAWCESSADQFCGMIMNTRTDGASSPTDDKDDDDRALLMAAVEQADRLADAVAKDLKKLGWGVAQFST